MFNSGGVGNNGGFHGEEDIVLGKKCLMAFMVHSTMYVLLSFDTCLEC